MKNWRAWPFFILSASTRVQMRVQAYLRCLLGGREIIQSKCAMLISFFRFLQVCHVWATKMEGCGRGRLCEKLHAKFPWLKKKLEGKHSQEVTGWHFDAFSCHSFPAVRVGFRVWFWLHCQMWWIWWCNKACLFQQCDVLRAKKKSSELCNT